MNIHSTFFFLLILLCSTIASGQPDWSVLKPIDLDTTVIPSNLKLIRAVGTEDAYLLYFSPPSLPSSSIEHRLYLRTKDATTQLYSPLPIEKVTKIFPFGGHFLLFIEKRWSIGGAVPCFLNRNTLEITVLPDNYAAVFNNGGVLAPQILSDGVTVLFHSRDYGYQIMSPTDPANPEVIFMDEAFSGFIPLSSGGIICKSSRNIYRFDGVDAGMELIYVLPEGVTTDGISPGDDIVYFSKSTGTLIASDGTAAGTHLLHSRFDGGVQAFSLTGISVVDNKATYFIEYTADGSSAMFTPWRTDGTPGGTVEVLDESDANFFRARSGDFIFSGQNALALVHNGNETEIHYTDYTSGNTRKVWDEGEAGLGDLTNVRLGSFQKVDESILFSFKYSHGINLSGTALFALTPDGGVPTLLEATDEFSATIVIYGKWAGENTWLVRTINGIKNYDATTEQLMEASPGLGSLPYGEFIEFGGGFLFQRNSSSSSEWQYLENADSDPLPLGFQTEISLTEAGNRLLPFADRLVFTDFEENRPKRFITVFENDFSVEIGEPFFQLTAGAYKQLALLSDHIAVVSNEWDRTFLIANNGDLVIDYPYRFLNLADDKDDPITEEIDDYLIIEDSNGDFIYVPKSFDGPPVVYPDKTEESGSGFSVQHDVAVLNGKHYYLTAKAIDFERIECDTFSVEGNQLITCDTNMVSEYEYKMNWYDPLANTVSRRTLDTIRYSMNSRSLCFEAGKDRIYFTMPYSGFNSNNQSVHEFLVGTNDFNHFTFEGGVALTSQGCKIKATPDGMIYSQGSSGGTAFWPHRRVLLGQTEANQIEDNELHWSFFRKEFVSTESATFMSGFPNSGTKKIVVLPVQGEALVEEVQGKLVLLVEDDNEGAVYGYLNQDSLSIYQASSEAITFIKKVRNKPVSNVNPERFVAYANGRVYYVSFEGVDNLNFLDIATGSSVVIPAINFGSYLPFRELTVLNETLYLVANSNDFGHESFYLDESGSRLVSGRMYRTPIEFDTLGIEHYSIAMEGPSTRTQAFTDENGTYGFLVNTREEYDLIVNDNGCVEGGFDIDFVTIPSGEEDFRQDFTFTAGNSETSLDLDVTGARMRCNTDVPYWVTINNTGCSDFSGAVQVTLPAGVTFLTSPDAPSAIEDNLVTFSVSELKPFDRITLQLLLEMPDETATGLDLVIAATAFNMIDEIVATTMETGTLRCAYDPNDKAVSPVRPDPGNNNYTRWDEELEYTIRFQNTGNDTAINVRIDDWLDPELDWTTLRLLAASHPYRTELSTRGKVSFLFENIMLPDSNINEPASHGFVKFSILPRSTIDFGTTVENTAYIYFDSNQPIITNTVSNELVEFIDEDMDGYPFWIDCQDDDASINPEALEISGNGIDENCDGDDFPTSLTDQIYSAVKVFPNPVRDELHIVGADGREFTARLFSSQGAVVGSTRGYGRSSFSLGNLSAGAYYLIVYNNRGESLYHGWVIHNN